jgi:hypothetical protein
MFRRHLATLCAPLILCALALSPTNARAQTDVSSDIASNTTWNSAGSPYRIKGTPTGNGPGPITVTAGNTLTIEAGVDVLFDADVQFIVQGKIITEGTASDSVRFLKGTASEWGSIRINAGENTFAYTRISDGNADHGGGLRVLGAGTKVSMNNCVISKR